MAIVALAALFTQVFVSGPESAGSKGEIETWSETAAVVVSWLGAGAA